jgi:hypothetical protein
VRLHGHICSSIILMSIQSVGRNDQVKLLLHVQHMP